MSSITIQIPSSFLFCYWKSSQLVARLFRRHYITLIWRRSLPPLRHPSAPLRVGRVHRLGLGVGGANPPISRSKHHNTNTNTHDNDNVPEEGSGKCQRAIRSDPFVFHLDDSAREKHKIDQFVQFSSKVCSTSPPQRESFLRRCL